MPAPRPGAAMEQRFRDSAAACLAGVRGDLEAKVKQLVDSVGEALVSQFAELTAAVLDEIRSESDSLRRQLDAKDRALFSQVQLDISSIPQDLKLPLEDAPPAGPPQGCSGPDLFRNQGPGLAPKPLWLPPAAADATADVYYPTTEKVTNFAGLACAGGDRNRAADDSAKCGNGIAFAAAGGSAMQRFYMNRRSATMPTSAALSVGAPPSESSRGSLARINSEPLMAYRHEDPRAASGGGAADADSEGRPRIDCSGIVDLDDADVKIDCGSRSGQLPQALGAAPAVSKAATIGAPLVNFMDASDINSDRGRKSDDRGVNSDEPPWIRNSSGSIPDSADERRDGIVSDIVRSPLFEGFFSVIILLNCFSMGVEADALVSPSPQPWLERTLIGMEHGFTVLFTIELVMRLWVYGYRAFLPTKIKNLWNFMDAVLVIFTGILFGWVLPLITLVLGAGGDNGLIRTFTVLRAVRLLRVVRVINKVQLFREVWLLLQGLTDSIRTLFWTCLVIFFITYIFAVFGIWCISNEIFVMHKNTNNDVDKEELEGILVNIGGMAPLLQMLIQFLTLDSWNAKMERIQKYSPWCWIYFYAYISVAVFVLMNLVTAIIVENAMANSSADMDQQLKQKENMRQNELKELRNLFFMMDADGDGTLDWAEFKAAFADPDLSKKWRLLDYGPDECRELFELLDDGDGGIDTDEFFNGLSRIKGPAQSRDLVRIQKQVERVTSTLGQVAQQLGLNPRKTVPRGDRGVGSPPAQPSVCSLLDHSDRD